MRQHSNSNTPGLSGRTKAQQLLQLTIAENRQFTSGISGKFLSQMLSDMVDCTNAQSDDDIIDFLDEECEPQTYTKLLQPWKILIADDDISVHDTTLLALAGVRIHNRPLEFLHAYSAKEAHQVLLENTDMSLVLLDVVMETVDAGLKLVGVIRNELNLKNLRIVLRTGQPGYAPEQQVNTDFAIDAYTTKSKLTRSILISVLNDTLNDSLSASSPAAGLPN
jgi:CheY-like chemotaxis protein